LFKPLQQHSERPSALFNVVIGPCFQNPLRWSDSATLFTEMCFIAFDSAEVKATLLMSSVHR
jgi:hypothetical protein